MLGFVILFLGDLGFVDAGLLLQWKNDVVVYGIEGFSYEFEVEKEIQIGLCMKLKFDLGGDGFVVFMRWG